MVDTHYRAFMSYSHRDRDAGEHLHKKLESYRTPSKLVGKLTQEGSVPRRLTPIFRDREDLSTSGSLSKSVESAISRSRFLIVMCSPAAAASEWVDAEVRLFKKQHGEGRILAAIVDSENGIGATDPDVLFPPSLRFHLDENGELTDKPAEPLAADFRESADGPKYAFLKIVAGLMGVGLDDLVQRDQHRRNTQMKVIAGGASGLALAMGALAFVAVNASRDAKLQRTEAEGLVEFMLTDFRDKLEEVGQLDALESTGDRVLDYYARQDADALDANSLGRRAKAQLLVGDILQRRNDLDAALIAYEAAATTTGELLSRAPNNSQRIFDHAQSVFWVGAVAHQRLDLETAEAQLRNYLRLAEKLVSLDGGNPDWRMELAYATSNLGSLKYAAQDYGAAAPFFEQSADAWRALSEAAPDDDGIAENYAYALSWQALTEKQRGNFENAKALYESQLLVYEPIQRRRPEDAQLAHVASVAERRLGETHLALGELGAAQNNKNAAKAQLQLLLARESGNADWNVHAANIYILESELYALSRDATAFANAADQAVAAVQKSAAINETDPATRKALGRSLARQLIAHGQSEIGIKTAAALVEVFDGAVSANSADLDIVGEGGLALAKYFRQGDDERRAHSIATTAYDALKTHDDLLSANMQFSQFQLCIFINGPENCDTDARALDLRGFRHPAYVAMRYESP